MKKHFLLFIVLIGLAPSAFCLEAQQEQKSNAKTVGWKDRVQNWQTTFKDGAAYEKDVWAKGLPAARKKLWYKKQLTKKEQLYFNALKKRVGGIAAIITLLVMVYGAYKVKKYYEEEEITEGKDFLIYEESNGKEEESSSSEEEREEKKVEPTLTYDEEIELIQGIVSMLFDPNNELAVNDVYDRFSPNIQNAFDYRRKKGTLWGNPREKSMMTTGVRDKLEKYFKKREEFDKKKSEIELIEEESSSSEVQQEQSGEEEKELQDGLTKMKEKLDKKAKDKKKSRPVNEADIEALGTELGEIYNNFSDDVKEAFNSKLSSSELHFPGDISQEKNKSLNKLLKYFFPGVNPD